MSTWKARRFWKASAVVPTATGYAVELDGRVVHTPLKTALVVPTRAMAEAIAAEWDAQEDVINPLGMPVTRSANAALDKVRPQRPEVASIISEYGDCDLLCYRASAPVELAARQAEAWNPLLDWADSALGVRLGTVTGVIHHGQSPEALASLRRMVEQQDDFALAALHDLVSLSGSLVIGLAALAEYRPADHLWTLSRLDESWQAELWGHDEEADETAAFKRAAFLHANRFYALSRAGRDLPKVE